MRRPLLKRPSAPSRRRSVPRMSVSSTAMIRPLPIPRRRRTKPSLASLPSSSSIKSFHSSFCSFLLYAMSDRFVANKKQNNKKKKI